MRTTQEIQAAYRCSIELAQAHYQNYLQADTEQEADVQLRCSRHYEAQAEAYAYVLDLDQTEVREQVTARDHLQTIMERGRIPTTPQLRLS